MAHVIERAEVPVDVHDLVRAARRAGAPVTVGASPADTAARALLAEIRAGHQPSPALAAALSEAVEPDVRRVRFRARGGGVEWRDPGRAGRGAARPVAARRSTAGAATPAMTEPSLPDKVVALHHALEHGGVAHAFGGALALAYYAEPRTTVDVDVNVFVTADHADDIAAALGPLGVDTTPLSGPLPARRDRSGADGDARPIDLFFSYDALHEAMRANTQSVPFGPDTIPILGPEHLVVCKAVFNRPKDWLDIEQVLATVDGFDAADAMKELERVVGRRRPARGAAARGRAAGAPLARVSPEWSGPTSPLRRPRARRWRRRARPRGVRRRPPRASVRAGPAAW